MHTKDGRAVGETEQRIYALPVWRDTRFFGERERAALAFAVSYEPWRSSFQTTGAAAGARRMPGRAPRTAAAAPSSQYASG